MILVDTAIWVDHLRSGVPELVRALLRTEVLTHPFVIGELALGTLRQRSEILELLAALPRAVVATEAEMLGFIDRAGLAGRGIGYLDAHLLAATRLTPDARLWTRDRRLSA
ncbi:MAG: type II toxin-antitoxin system VapC family toxin, partial [Acetobacteraceae bacterium]